MIRKANVDDTMHIAKLKVEGFKNAHRGIISQHFLNNINIEEEHNVILRNIAACEEDHGYHVYVADNVQKILGFCAINKNANSVNNTEAEIVDLHVNSSYSDMGIGKNMFSYIKEEMKKENITSAVTWVLEDNKEANKFCKINGGSLIGEKYEEIGMQNLKLNGYKFKL